MNLLELVEAQLTDEVLGSLGGALGESRDAARRVLTRGAVPAIIAGLGQALAAKPAPRACSTCCVPAAMTAGCSDASPLPSGAGPRPMRSSPRVAVFSASSSTGTKMP